MKSFILTLALISTTALAAEIKVYDQPKGYHDHESAVFNINKDLGRAWVEVNLEKQWSDETYTDTVRTLVPGLSYDAQTKTINLDHEGQLVECAALKTSGRSIFRITRIVNTNCDLVKKEVVVEYDNGFEIKKQKRVQFFLVTK